MDQNNPGEIDYTENAWESIYRVVDGEYFQDHEADYIFAELTKRIRVISFGDYLKRYLYEKKGMEKPFHLIEDKEFQQVILDSFRETGTPQSFFPTSTKLTTLAAKWLKQMSAGREVVFLLGFGLSMSVADVNNFLRKGIQEQGINAKNPLEVVCWYCYKNGYGFSKFRELWEHYLDMNPDTVFLNSMLDERTVNVRINLFSIQDEPTLFAMISGLKMKNNEMRFSVTGRANFDRLYAESRRLIAKMFNENNSSGKHYTPEEIGPGDLERVIYSTVPVDKYGNLMSQKQSALSKQFQGKRLTRQKISGILSGKNPVTRFELITLNFFIFSQRVEEFATVHQRYDDFLRSTNEILEECDLGLLYIANPYEALILMCILSEDPLVTYADVVELSYED